MMTPSLAIYRGLKRAGIDFAASVPCVNLQQLLTLVGEDPRDHPRARHPRGGGRGPVRRSLDGRPKACPAHAKLGSWQLHQCPGLARSSLRHSPAHDHKPPGRQRASRWWARCPWAGSRLPLLDAMQIPHFSPTCAEAEDAVNRCLATELQPSRRPAAVLLDLDFWRGA